MPSEVIHFQLEEVIYSVVNDVDDLEVFDFSLTIGPKALNCVLVLDHLTNRYGSPSFGECATVINLIKITLKPLMDTLGFQNLKLLLKVSSPGAERILSTPKEFARFAGLPCIVKYFSIEPVKNKKKLLTDYMEYIKMEGEILIWRVFLIKKQRKKTLIQKKKNKQEVRIALSDINYVRLYVDV